MHHPPKPQRGLTLIEAATVTAIAAVLVGIAAPGLQDTRLRRQVEGVAAQLETDLQLARAEAIARNETVRVGFARGAGGSCYVLHTGPADACRCDGQGRTTCEPGAEALRTVPLDATSPVQLRANSASMAFDASLGTVTPTGTLRVQSPAGSLHQVVNIMGRIRSCSPDGWLAGYRRC
jgi:type IV fimbrial biogenesis protein FimT